MREGVEGRREGSRLRDHLPDWLGTCPQAVYPSHPSAFCQQRVSACFVYHLARNLGVCGGVLRHVESRRRRAAVVSIALALSRRRVGRGLPLPPAEALRSRDGARRGGRCDHAVLSAGAGRRCVAAPVPPCSAGAPLVCVSARRLIAGNARAFEPRQGTTATDHSYAVESDPGPTILPGAGGRRAALPSRNLGSTTAIG
jgi:hypothetical protein